MKGPKNRAWMYIPFLTGLVLSFQGFAPVDPVAVEKPDIIQPQMPDHYIEAEEFGLAPPKVEVPKISTRAKAGETVILSASAHGERLRFQWFVDDEPIFGAESAQYKIPEASPVDAMEYTVMVYNESGLVKQIFDVKVK